MKGFKLLFLLPLVFLINCQKAVTTRLVAVVNNSTSLEGFIPLNLAAKIAFIYKQNPFSISKGNKLSLGSVKSSAGSSLNDCSINFTKKTISESFTLNDSLQNPIAHVFNYVGGGFLIVAAFNREHPILAFSDKNTFLKNIDKRNNVNGWVRHEGKRIRQLKKSILKEKDSTLIKKEWTSYATQTNTPGLSAGIVSSKTSTPTCRPGYVYECNENDAGKIICGCVSGVTCAPNYVAGPFLRTTWDQGNSYNIDCPATSNPLYSYHSPTGCVPTAIAQIMKYWGKGAYQNNSFNYSDAAMPLTFGSSETARLMAQIGSYIPASYGTIETSVSIIAAQNVIPIMFLVLGYAHAAIWDAGGNYPNMWAEVRAGRPFLFMGGDHCWVFDGVNAVPTGCIADPNYVSGYTPYWHKNFGWSGTDNGYYAYGAINPADDATLNNSDNSIMQIHP